jgi:acetoin utilization deacetylase AcuC-like enzyme
MRELIITQGTIECCHHAMRDGVALNVAGGTHHAYRDRGEGFCLLNDMAIASNYLLSKNLTERILIIDLDVHQGNGTARIFEDIDEVFTFSMHGAHNYPFHKETSNLDIPLPDGIMDNEYLALLKENLDRILGDFKPDFAFYLSGVDILSTDKFGKLKITPQGCRERDEIVFRKLSGRTIPCTVAMGGGYSPDIRHIVDAHCNTYRCARNIYN